MAADEVAGGARKATKSKLFEFLVHGVVSGGKVSGGGRRASELARAEWRDGGVGKGCACTPRGHAPQLPPVVGPEPAPALAPGHVASGRPAGRVEGIGRVLAGARGGTWGRAPTPIVGVPWLPECCLFSFPGGGPDVAPGLELGWGWGQDFNWELSDHLWEYCSECGTARRR